MVAFPTILMAADWSTRTWADARMEFSDNLQLRTRHPNDAAGLVMNAGIQLKRTGEQGYLSLTPTLRASRYDSKDPLDSNDQMLAAEWSRRGERSSWRLNGDWTRDTTLTSELEVSGLVQTRNRRLRRSLSPSYSFALSQRSTIAADFSYTTTKYDNASFTGLVNYDYLSADVSTSYRWSERTGVAGTLYGTHFQASQINNRTNTAGARLQISTTLTEWWDGKFGLGIYRSYSNYAGSDGNGGLIDLSLHRMDEKGDWRADVKRSIDPSGTGVLVQRDRLSLTRHQQFNDQWYGSVGGNWIVNKDLQAVSAIQDRRYRTATLRLSHILTRTWRIDAEYTYTWQRFAAAAAHAENNEYVLNIHYSEKQDTE